MENFLALQAAAARPPLAVVQGHAMLRRVHHRPVTALEGAVTFRIGRFVRGDGGTNRARRPQYAPAMLLRSQAPVRPALRDRD